MDLAMRIRIARQRARLSQEMLAAQLGVTRGAVANWESAVGVMPATARLERLACVTGVRFEWLATGRGPLAYDESPAAEPPADAELVDDPLERRLLLAFRTAGRETRRMLLGLAEAQLASSRVRRSG